MEIFNIVKCGDTYYTLENIPKLTYQAHCFEKDNCIMQFIHSLGISELSDNVGLLKSHYNPLLIKQNLLLITSDNCYEVPFLLLQHQKHLAEISQHVKNIHSSHEQATLIALIKYTFTKDFMYLYPLIATHAHFHLSLFSALNKAITIQNFNKKYFESAISILQGQEPEITPVYGEYLDRKNHMQNMNHTIYSKIKNTSKKKNVIFIHLESLSNEIYYNQLHNLPHLKDLMARSLLLNRYFSSATSSCMSLVDLFFGNDFESDRFTVFDDMYLTNLHQKNMFEIFRENGYDVLGLGYKETQSEEINGFNLWTVKGQQYEWKDNYADFIDRIQNFIQQTEKPFALHIWNLMTHLGHKDADTYKGATQLERMDISYTSLDMTIKAIIDTLNTKGILDDTILIGYGDHGDDKWTRALNYGCTHIVAPHLNVIHTPAFIYDTRIGTGLYNNLVSTVDMKSTALFLAGINYHESFTHGGINIFEKQNEVVYARSLLTNQREYASIGTDWVIRLNNFSPIEHKNKSFGIINEHYNMLVENSGISFFMHSNDPGNYNNLLHFFEIDASGNITRFNNHSAWRGHFRTLLMADDQIFDILKNYYQLRRLLMDRINLKYALINETEENRFNMNYFNIVSPRDFIWQ